MWGSTPEDEDVWSGDTPVRRDRDGGGHVSVCAVRTHWWDSGRGPTFDLFRLRLGSIFRATTAGQRSGGRYRNPYPQAPRSETGLQGVT